MKNAVSNFSMIYDNNMNTSLMSQHKSSRDNEEDNIYASNIKSKIMTNNHMTGIKYLYSINRIWSESLRKTNLDSDENEGIIEG